MEKRPRLLVKTGKDSQLLGQTDTKRKHQGSTTKKLQRKRKRNLYDEAVTTTKCGRNGESH